MEEKIGTSEMVVKTINILQNLSKEMLMGTLMADLLAFAKDLSFEEKIRIKISVETFKKDLASTSDICDLTLEALNEKENSSEVCNEAKEESSISNSDVTSNMIH